MRLRRHFLCLCAGGARLRVDLEGEIAFAAEKAVEFAFVERERAVRKGKKSVFHFLFVAGGVDFRNIAVR